MDNLFKYQKMALKLAQVVDLGPEGHAAKIPGFKGLLAVGKSKKEALTELESALADWVNLALKRGLGLPTLASAQEKSAVKV
ncbi:type II toxin-antitoxin system HicB family antitoxin [Prosthecobacter debontii]|uniref:type II toxin-antitoxin system HicB family antitoxin n=1 Tax=Prosthecobacter debontii TaxID=48467 RepID=UPI001116B216|nr:type II toxin-antitoxin system HicB family antitoxin [Prosthecobacter debontii]